MEILNEFPDDYEKFCNLRDNLIHNRNQELIYSSCKVCGSSLHDFQDCESVTYFSDSFKVKRKSTLECENRRSNLRRRKKFRNHNVLLSIEYFTRKALQIQDLDQVEMDEIF